MSETMFDDGSEVVVVTEEDEPPRDGVWVDAEDLLHNPTDQELVEGERLGREIDVHDDEDNGL